MALHCERLHLVPQCPVLKSTLDDTKILKIILLLLDCEQALKANSHDAYTIVIVSKLFGSVHAD